MKKQVFALLLVVLFLNSTAQNYDQLIHKADSCYFQKNFSLAKEFFKKAFECNSKTKKGFYNAACVAALANDKDLAFAWLGIAIENGFDNINQIKADADLQNLHNDTRWLKVNRDLQDKANLREANYDKPLQKELIAIFYEDQAIRHQLIESQKRIGYEGNTVDSIGKIMKYKDSINLNKIEKIISEKGWVGKDKVGQQASTALWLVIQHSDLKTQQNYLPIMREAVKKGNADVGSLVLLEDRVALAEGRKQIYGSQIGTNPTTGKQFVLPLADPDNVDKRRAEVGLEPLSEYVKSWNIIWDAETYKKENQLSKK